MGGQILDLLAVLPVGLQPGLSCIWLLIKLAHAVTLNA